MYLIKYSLEEHSQRKRRLIEEYVRQHEGRRPIQRILIANNGLAAVKAIRSMRRWAFETFGDTQTLHFIAMATPEDMRADAEHVRLADQVGALSLIFVQGMPCMGGLAWGTALVRPRCSAPPTVQMPPHPTPTPPTPTHTLTHAVC